MAGNSVIGALRIDLGLNSAQFTAGLKDAQGNLSRFSSLAAKGFVALSAAAATAAVALGVAVKGELAHADALSKSSQKAGVAVEALSRLEYAAKLSDVSLEGLTGGLQKLSKTMVEAATNGGSKAAMAFSALGVSIKDSAGNLRDTDAVFTDIAERFARLEDGATKTSLSLMLFGKSGADLIPLLNSGSNGLRQMAEESDRVGATISTKTAKAAEEFNDTLTRVQTMMQGVVVKTTTALLPSLQAIADIFVQIDPTALSVGAAIAGIAAAATLAAPAVATLTSAVALLYGQLALIAALPAGVLAIAGAIYLGSTSAVGAGEDALIRELGIGPRVDGAVDNGIDFNSMFAPVAGNSTFGSTGEMWSALKPLTIDLDDLTTGLKNVQPHLDPFAARMGELSGVLTATVDPFDQMKLDLTDLGTMLEHGAITAEQYGNAVSKTYWNMASNVADALAQVTGALAGAFKDNKALAIANVVVSTAAGAMKAFEQGGIFGWIGAGSIIAAGAGQIANILATEPGNAKTPSLSGGGSGSAAAQAQQSSAVNLTIKGSGNINMDDLAEGLAKTIGKGGAQPLVNVIREL